MKLIILTQHITAATLEEAQRKQKYTRVIEAEKSEDVYLYDGQVLYEVKDSGELNKIRAMYDSSG